MTKTDAEIYDALMAAGVKPGMLLSMSDGAFGFVYLVESHVINSDWRRSGIYIASSNAKLRGYMKGDSETRDVWPTLIQGVEYFSPHTGFGTNRTFTNLKYKEPTSLSGKTCKLEVDGVTYNAKLEVA